MTRRALALVCAVAAMALSGCVVFTGPFTGQQQDLIGKVRVSFTLCASGDPTAASTETHPGCPDEGNSGVGIGDGFADSEDVQILLAFRVPAGTGAPPTIVADPVPDPPAGGAVTLTRNSEYDRELARLLPPPDGFEWIGYLSEVYPFNNGADGVAAQSAAVSVDFELPRRPDGGAFPGPFRVRPVVGFRTSTSEIPFTRAVSCGDYPFGGTGGQTTCIDSPSPGSIGVDIAVVTNDLALLPGSVQGVSPGQAVAVPFNVQLVGSLPVGTTFALSAATTLPGVTPAPEPASLAPQPNSTNRVTVPITIPPGIPPGIHDLALTAALPNGQQRTSTAKVTVRDRQDPVLRRLRLRPKRIRPGAPSLVQAAAGARVSFTLSEAASVRFTVQRKRGRRFRKLRGSFKHAGKAGANSLRFTGFLRGRPLKRGRYRLVATPTDGAGNKGKSTRTGFRIRG